MSKKPYSHNTVSSADLLLQGLNTEQQDAASTVDGPVLILAGAGSGKTKTLVHRIAYMIASGVKPWNILAVTFTNKAAENMRERMKLLLGKELEHMPLMGTFHSICVKLLRREAAAIGFANNFVIYDDGDQLTLTKKVMKDLGYDTKQVSPQTVHWRISGAKNMLLSPEAFADTVSDFMGEIAAKVYPLYQKELKEHNAMDFDDLIMKVVELFQQYPEVLAKYQKLWQYILVDEYQDTNRAQYLLVSLLADKHHNICVVGDDAQSIYGWRMADIGNILDFEKTYPDAKVILLEQNYRSTQTILDASNEVISKNKNQKKKKLWTENPKGEPLAICEVPNEEAEGMFIVKRIMNLDEKSKADPEEIVYEKDDSQPDYDENPIQPGESILERIMKSRMFQQGREDQDLQAEVKRKRSSMNFAQFVVLYRTNAQSRPIEEAFVRYGVPYKLIGGMRFYDRREIKDVLAYLRSVFNPNDWVALERIVNAPPRGIGDRTWFKIEQFAREHQFDVLEAAKHDIPTVQSARVQAFYQFAAILRDVREQMPALNPSELLELLLKESGYKDYILNNSENKEQGEARWENIQELKNVTQKFRHLRGEEGLQAFLEDVSLVSDQDQVDETENAVKLMTVHAAKGLEFPTVFVIGMEDGLFPHSRALTNPQEMEEERRLCYVAITRAINKVYLIFAAQRMRFGNLQVNPMSRFIDDIPGEFVKWLQHE